MAADLIFPHTVVYAGTEHTDELVIISVHILVPRFTDDQTGRGVARDLTSEAATAAFTQAANLTRYLLILDGAFLAGGNPDLVWAYALDATTTDNAAAFSTP